MITYRIWSCCCMSEECSSQQHFHLLSPKAPVVQVDNTKSPTGECVSSTFEHPGVNDVSAGCELDRNESLIFNRTMNRDIYLLLNDTGAWP